MRALRLLIAVLISGSLASAAQAQVLRDFRVYPAQSALVFTWTLSTGSTCQNLQVEQSLDSVNFETIHIYPGVCGSPTEEQTYYWTHSEPVLNRTVWYRLILGPTSQSDVVVYRFMNYGSSGVLVFPNPVQQGSSIFVRDIVRGPVTLSLMNLQGNVILQTELRQSEFPLDAVVFPQGKYLYRLEWPDGTRRSGALIVN